MMKRILLFAVLLFAAGQAEAGPYFRWEPFSEFRYGAFFEPTATVNDKRVGIITPMLRHHAEDGNILIRGVDWDPLTAGWAAGTDDLRGTVFVGPSVNLEEPLKRLLLKAVRALPKGKRSESYQALKSALQPAKASDQNMTIGLGTGLGVSVHKSPGRSRGHWLLSTTLNKKFGGFK